MRCEIWDTAADRLIRVDENASPACGEDFCDNCGDCLACADPDDLCHASKDGLHRWIRYVTPSGEKLKTPDDDLFMRIYVDQHPHGTDGLGYRVYSAYTRWGIRQLDSLFGQAIRSAKTIEACSLVARRLREDCHLHRIIKSNLFLNLHRIARSLRRTGVDLVG